ncbi:MAG TPA: DUF4399 domain-containing protein [Steroidobacter sp.]|jgi:hypothetical protein|nr:DUF4399 domain-containing protein [Steroidobacter sp.]
MTVRALAARRYNHLGADAARLLRESLVKPFMSFALVAAGLIAAGALAQAKRTPSPAGAEVYFIAPRDGETVSSPVAVKFGIRGMAVAPAGVASDNSGHHHLIVDADLPPLDAPIPADAHHLHFGKGQTETTLELKPGKHTLQLLLGDSLHIPHEPPVRSKQITIAVVGE